MHKTFASALFLFTLVIGSAVAVDAQAVSATPQKTALKPVYKSPNGTFSIKFSSEPKINTEDLGSGMKSKYFIAESEELFIIVAEVSGVPMTAKEMEISKATLFQSFRDGFIKGLTTEFAKTGTEPKVVFAEPSDIKFKGLIGFHQNVAIGNFAAQTRMLFAKESMYMFFAFPMPGADMAIIESSFASFEYHGKPAAKK